MSDSESDVEWYVECYVPFAGKIDERHSVRQMFKDNISMKWQTMARRWVRINKTDDTLLVAEFDKYQESEMRDREEYKRKHPRSATPPPVSYAEWLRCMTPDVSNM